MSISVNNLYKSFGEIRVLNGVNLNITKGSFTSIIGPSGCGKTTLLDALVGITSLDSGSIDIKDNYSIGYLQQGYHLLKWRTLEENVLLGIELNQELTNKPVEYYLEKFGLEKFKNKYPQQLSGGMKQRACLIRTLCLNPSLLLLDEPFVSLDFDIKFLIQRELIEYQKRNNATIIMVTHDLEDAIALSDQVVVLTKKPTSVKTKVDIHLDLEIKDPVEARKAVGFRSYFTHFIDELKYMEHETVN